MTSIQKLNQLSKNEFCSKMIECCSSLKWVENMSRQRPFKNHNDLLDWGKSLWQNLDEFEINEALNSFSFKDKYILNDEEIKAAIDVYENKFEFPFIPSSSVTTPAQFKEELYLRTKNDQDLELESNMEYGLSLLLERLDLLLSAMES